MNVSAASLSVLSQSAVRDQVDVAVMKMAKDQAENQGAQLLKLLNSSTPNIERVAQPHLGQNIDIKG